MQQEKAEESMRMHPGGSKNKSHQNGVDWGGVEWRMRSQCQREPSFGLSLTCTMLLTARW